VIGKSSSTTTAVVLLDVAPRDGGFEARQTVCDIRVSQAVGAVRTVLPKALQALGNAEIQRFSPREVGARVELEFERSSRVWGAQLTEPRAEALPTSPSDPRVFDADRDGKPGVTVAIKGMVEGEIYLVQRDSSVLRGALLPSGEVRGSLEWSSEVSVLDATSPLLMSPPASTPDPARSTFRMVRIDSADTCATVLPRLRELLK
jgi:hypothetical protein